MMRPLSFKHEAETDIQEAFDWYEARARGLGVRFLLAADATLARIQHNPLGYQIVYRSFRRAVVHRFPYIVLYVVRKQDVVIVGCISGRRNPAYWKARA
jgi:plasmid stabilization system protein ParE